MKIKKMTPQDNMPKTTTLNDQDKYHRQMSEIKLSRRRVNLSPNFADSANISIAYKRRFLALNGQHRRKK
jgi:hypothetical protein